MNTRVSSEEQRESGIENPKCIQAAVKQCATLLLLMGMTLVINTRCLGQTLTTLHTFGPVLATTNSLTYNDDGISPSDLVLFDNVLYGTTSYGSTSGLGTVFRVNTDGSDFRTLHVFSQSDGGNPNGHLIISGSTVYGATTYGGNSGWGSIFAINTDGTRFTNLYSFSGYDGYCWSKLLVSGQTLYGTTTGGTVFALNTDGSGYANVCYLLTDLTGTPATSWDGVCLSGGTLYGVVDDSGSDNYGSVFAVGVDGTNPRTIYSFTGGADGRYPRSALVLSGSTLWGTALGNNRVNGYDPGSVFKLNTDGSGFQVLHTCRGGSSGAFPGGPTFSDTLVYVACQGGGDYDKGMVFAVKTDGTGFTNLYSFSNGSDGAYPYCSLVLSGSSLFGTAQHGTWGNGIIFGLSMAPPQLNMMQSGSNLILTWPLGWTLESTTDFSTSWSTDPTVPVVVNGQNTATISMSASQQFFRLSR